MKKTIAILALLFVMVTNLNATETPIELKDTNCTVEKCKTQKAKDANCTVEKCKTQKKKDCTLCDGKGCEKCEMDSKSPTWSASKDGNSKMKMSACCKNKKNKETKTAPKEEAPMKCAPGKCGSGKCGGK